MKIVVVGGTGLIGSQVVSLLGERGHEAVAVSQSTGVDVLTGEGLGQALTGADAVVDVTNSPSFEDGAALDFFTRSTKNLTAAGREAGVGHHVILSIVGVDRVPGLGYYRAKVAQEELLARSGVPYSIVRATQFFEFVDSIMALTTDGGTVRLPSTLMRPIASADVAAAVADTTQGEPLNGRREIAGPEVLRLDRLGEITLAARPDGRSVTTDEGAGMFAGIPDGVVSGDGSVPTATTRYEDWLRRS
ncbi:MULTISPECIES: SDR family oxidoreductase [Nocardiopsis]|uniref:NAD-dependent epimerase/dehydratase n=1 Tax=Nocardiopsis dassonvillei (strain ATCC 23218 / DSM 43111 / CIP 107115 / JCM 7437 / KCTC 9190 / NBRC 14626 / NCTC 10488 / NRRL B-5397 / IMRU 509) TaxID=446468 RepID=D7B0N0_NOCDD|nr:MULTISPECIES: NAD(P)H-binding protein [Nocardiopsis]ADH66437.1 NAD-dependent epimerase/dehydratase [Nocardiopsis dassonvillei subsp. dassonvillei DSM 43111]NKY77824.1 NAD(P)H-binding protein [Nocardiopsis dassonvillei]VEI92458.1 Putative NADH-flavin reductase [Nocardiopsis dassonvillei]